MGQFKNMGMADITDEEAQLLMQKRASRKSSMFIPRRSKANSIFSVASQASSIIDQTKKPNYLNTYKTEPDAKPSMKEIRDLIENIVSASCEGTTYEETLDREICQVINNEVHLRIKPFIPRRYRMTAQVFIVERNNQDILTGTKWLWNEKHDNHTYVCVQQPTFCCIVIVHCIYLE